MGYIPESGPLTLWVSATAATGQAVTASLPLAAGKYHCIGVIQIVRYATAAITGTATPIVVTTTNFPSAAQFAFARAAAVGASDQQQFNFERLLRSAVAGAATTIVCPAVTGVIWQVNVAYSLSV
jgi:hypothetical protein